MRSSSRAGARLFALLLALLGLGLVARALSAPAADRLGPAFEVLLGLVLLAMGFVVWIARGSGADPGRRARLATLDDEPALEVRLRPVTPLVMVVVGTSFAVLFAAAVVGVGVTDGGLLFLPLVLLFAALVPDGLRALLRRPALTLGLDAVELRGWTLDARLAWEDVEAVRADTTDPRRARLAITGRPGAPSWRVRSHRLLLPLERRPPVPEVAVLLSALDAGARVEVLARRFAEGGREERRGYLDRDGVGFLAKEF